MPVKSPFRDSPRKIYLVRAGGRVRREREPSSSEKKEEGRWRVVVERESLYFIGAMTDWEGGALPSGGRRGRDSLDSTVVKKKTPPGML